MSARRGAIGGRHPSDPAVTPAPRPKVVALSTRELSVEDWLARGAAFLREVIALARQARGNPDIPFLASAAGPRHGTLSNWNWFVGNDFDAKVLPGLLDAMDAADDPVLDLTAASALQSLERIGRVERWLEPEPPLIITGGGHGGLRIGAFNWTTDRDRFVRAMLGDPVPMIPRHSPTGPSQEIELVGDLWDAQEASGFAVGDAAELFRVPKAEAVASLSALEPVVSRPSGGGLLASALMRLAPEAWADGPMGRYLLPLSRGAPGWRSPRIATEWAAAFDLGVVGVHGVAIWAPGAYEMRKHRRSMAAHLRYLFDRVVSPWNRLAAEHHRREAMIVYWRRRLAAATGEREPTIEGVCSVVRKRWAGSYADEPREATLRRLYRMSASINAPRRRRRKGS